jgi:hypothetical protein
MFDHFEAFMKGHSPIIAEGSYDCSPETSLIKPDNASAFIYLMFNLYKVLATCFPGFLSMLPLASVEKADQKIRDFQAQTPTEFTVPAGYIPSPT